MQRPLILGSWELSFSVAVALLFFYFCAQRIDAASAVATGIGPDGKMRYGYAEGGVTADEAAVRSRAFGACMALGAQHPKFIAATSKRGYGVIVIYYLDDKRFNFTAAVAAKSEQEAITEALRKGRSAGGRSAKVVRRWHDVPSEIIHL